MWNTTWPSIEDSTREAQSSGILLLFSQTALLLLLIDGAKPTGTHKQPLVVLIVRRRVEARNKAQLEANVRQGCPFADKRT